MTVEPLRDMVLATLMDLPAGKHGTIEVVRLERQPTWRAKVTAVGPEVKDVRIGQCVVLSRLQGIEIDNGQILLPETAVLGFVEGL